jgi:hypothetical protein
MKRAPLKPDRRHLRVGEGHAAGIATAIDFRSDAQPGATVRGADQAHDRGQIHERRAAPVHGDVRKESMFDAVSLAGARREETEGDRQHSSIGESLQFSFPESEPRPIAPASAVITSGRVRGYADRPIRCRQRWIAFTAKLAVS